jgi:WD40 repeat protein
VQCASVDDDWRPYNPTISPNGEFVAFHSRPWGSIRGRIHIFCRRKGLVQSWEAHDEDGIPSIAYSPDGNLLVSIGLVEEVKFWDAANDYTCIQTLRWDNKKVRSVAFSPKGDIIVIGGHCNRDYSKVLLSLWKVSGGSKIREVEFEVYCFCIHRLKFSLDGQAVAVCGAMYSNNVFFGLWKLDGTEYVCITLEGHTKSVKYSAFSPDGKCFVSSGIHKAIKLWDFRTSRCIKTFTGHTGRVYSISFSPDGKFIVSGGATSIRTWNLETGNCVYKMNAAGRVHSVGFSADGKQVITLENWSIHVRSTAELGLL